ncbi:MAG: NAD(P)-dependent oxidoreductase [Rhodocyclaceae bacterium]|nr:NAD(P)-dependent oxidoreductase [Rhodocyclaceae bacterium]
MIPAEDCEDILARTAPLWEELRGKRLFITGGTGFFGQWLLGSFLHINDRLNLDAQVWILSRREHPTTHTHPALTFVHGDVRNFTFPEASFSHIIHAATTSAAETFHGEPPLSKIDTVVEGTRRVLDFAAHCRATKFLLTSSGNAYGQMPAHAQTFHEDDQCSPDLTTPIASALGESKRIAELLTRIYANTHGFEAKIGRCFTFIGPHLPLDIHYAIGNFIRDALDGRPIVVEGDGTPLRSWMYMTDLTVWLWTLLFRGVPNRLYNVGSDEAVSVGDAAQRVASLTNTSVIFKNVIETRLTASPNIYVPDTRRITRELCVTRTVDLNEAIHKTVKFYKSLSVASRMIEFGE